MPKLILLQDIEDLGNAGDIVNVTNGHARNFLIPKGLAVTESKAALRKLAAGKEKIEARRKEEMEKATKIAEKIASIELSISVQASDDKQLFGSVSASSISAELAKQGIEIESRKILLENPIRTTGDYVVKVKVHKDLTPELKIKVLKA
ncbi:MAG TPA: 50S ribosomal protein L9 [Victivallales bacterium]|nr:50S ribosomal protein L9 [Victivallales bacterium]